MHADFGRALQSSELQTHARHEPQASGAVSLLSAIATALSTAATAALEVVVVRPAVVALLDEGLRAAYARPDMSLSTVRTASAEYW